MGAGSSDIIKELSESVIDHFSFEYRTLREAKRTVTVRDKFCVFDGTTLIVYDHNLTEEEYDCFKRQLNCFLQKLRRYEKEKEKEFRERRVLFGYLDYKDNPYANYVIEKNIRPDFILYGEKKGLG